MIRLVMVITVFALGSVIGKYFVTLECMKNSSFYFSGETYKCVPSKGEKP